MRGKKEQGKNNVNFFFDIYSLRNFEMGGGGSLAGCGHPSVLLLACSLNTIDFQHEGKFVYSTQKIIIISIILFLPPHTLSLFFSPELAKLCFFPLFGSAALLLLLLLRTFVRFIFSTPFALHFLMDFQCRMFQGSVWRDWLAETQVFSLSPFLPISLTIIRWAFRFGLLCSLNLLVYIAVHS